MESWESTATQGCLLVVCVHVVRKGVGGWSQKEQEEDKAFGMYVYV